MVTLGRMRQLQKEFNSRLVKSKSKLVNGNIVEAAGIIFDAQFLKSANTTIETIRSGFLSLSQKIFKNWHHASHEEKMRAINALSLVAYNDTLDEQRINNINKFLIILHNNVAFANVFLQVFSFILFKTICDYDKGAKRFSFERMNEETLKNILLDIIKRGPEQLFADYVVLNVADPKLRSENDRGVYKAAVKDLYEQLKPKDKTEVSWDYDTIEKASIQLEDKLTTHFPVFLSKAKGIVHSGFWEQLKRVVRDTISTFASIIRGHAKEKPLTTVSSQSNCVNATHHDLVTDDTKANVYGAKQPVKAGLRVAVLRNTFEDVKRDVEKINGLKPPASRAASPAA